jgi:hypothetical protein
MHSCDRNTRFLEQLRHQSVLDCLLGFHVPGRSADPQVAGVQSSMFASPSTMATRIVRNRKRTAVRSEVTLGVFVLPGPPYGSKFRNTQGLHAVINRRPRRSSRCSWPWAKLGSRWPPAAISTTRARLNLASAWVGRNPSSLALLQPPITRRPLN